MALIAVLKIEEDFIKLIFGDSEFNETFEIVKKNSSGNIWLIGGYVYRNLAHCLYGTEKSCADLDFLVEKTKPEIVLPSGWRFMKNSYGNPKFVFEGLSVDCVPLSNVNSILRRKLEPTFENYLTGTPLTIQSVGYSVDDKRIVGDMGVRALLDKTVGINDLEQAEISASKKGLSIEELVRKRADSLGFRAV